MSIFVFLFFLLINSSVSIEHIKEEQNLVVSAIRLLLVEYFVANCPKVDLWIIGEYNGFAETIVDDLLQSLPEDISVKVTRDKSLVKFAETSTIFLFDSIEQFYRLSNELPIFVDSQGIWFKHLFYAPGLTSGDVSKEFQMNQYIGEVGFLFDSNKSSIELATAYWFTPQACHENQIITINRYSRDTRRWENSNFYPNKYQNFHGCIIEVLYSEDSTNPIGAWVFATLSAKLNFKLNRPRVDYVGLQNFNWNLNLTEVITSQNEVTNQQSLSPAIFFDALAFVVPPGEPLTDLEKMFAAFDKETWIAIGATFFIALVVIQVIKRLSLKVQNLSSVEASKHHF
jgi:hypothetical protein